MRRWTRQTPAGGLLAPASPREEPCAGCGKPVLLDGPGWVVTADSRLWHHNPARSCLNDALDAQRRLAAERAAAAEGDF